MKLNSNHAFTSSQLTRTKAMPSQPSFGFNYSTLQLKSSLLKNDIFQQLKNQNILSQFLHDLVELEPMIEFQTDLEEEERWSP